MPNQIFSGYIQAQQGFNGPAPFAGPQGWTVNKQQQTEIYVVSHNLNLANPQTSLHVTVTTTTPFIVAFVTVAQNTFRVTTWQLGSSTPQAPTPAATDFMFVAAYNT